MVLYFTGTGNCLYVARQLAKEGTELLSIPQLMKQKKFEIDKIKDYARFLRIMGRHH